MEVSSVKNLNGNEFSAVQDAALTDVVQTNSGNWQDITAYQNASGSYLTSHQAISAEEWNSNYDTVNTNSGNWDRINALSGYSANGWSIISQNRLIIASAERFNASGIPQVTGYLTVSGGSNYWCTISTGGIYMFDRNRSSSAQGVRPDTIVKWNNYDTEKLNVSDFKLSALNDASANNIVLTASLPATPDANTLYLIPEV